MSGGRPCLRERSRVSLRRALGVSRGGILLDEVGERQRMQRAGGELGDVVVGDSLGWKMEPPSADRRRCYPNDLHAGRSAAMGRYGSRPEK